MKGPADKPTPPDEYAVTIAEAARRLHVSYSTIQRLIYAGELETVRIGPQTLRVLVASILAYLERQKRAEQNRQVARPLTELRQRERESIGR